MPPQALWQFTSPPWWTALCTIEIADTNAFASLGFSIGGRLATSMWPQTGHLPGSQSSQPPLARSYPSVSVIYCQLEQDQALEFSPGGKQLDWWHRLCLVCMSQQRRYLCCCAPLGNILLEAILA